MLWRFTILNRNNEPTVIDEPPGFDKSVSEIKRDPDYHGVFFTNQGDTFEFYGPAMKLLKSEHEQYGFEGNMILVMEEDCGNGFEEFSRGRFDFNKYEFYCGDSCYIKIPVENSGEVIELRNRLNQKVNLESLKAFDLTTDLAAYGKLPFGMELPSKGIFMQDKAVWAEEAINTVLLSDVPNIEYDSNPSAYNRAWFQIIPQFDKTKFSEFGRFTTAIAPEHEYIKSGFYPVGLDPVLEHVIGDFSTPPDNTRIYFDWVQASPLLVNEKNGNNFDAVSSFSSNMDYSFEIELTTGHVIALYNILVIRRKDGTFEYLEKDRIFSPTFGGGPGGYNSGSIWLSGTTHTIAFSSSHTGISLADGDYLFTAVVGMSLYINTEAADGLEAYKIRSISGSVALETLSKSTPSISNVFAINETISRIAESITNNKLKGYSEYFGRTDSQPYALPTDGCGSLEVVTDGIRIRRQENKIPGTTNVFALSLQDVFEGLNPIHNIGMGIEPDTNRSGFNRLRVEPWHYFYNDDIIMSCTDIGQITRKAYDREAYSTFQFGYAKWEAEEYNGLDEFLTKRNYRTTLIQVKNDLVKLSKMIASGYALEITRRKGNDNTKDWRYDKEVFIICCKRNDDTDIIVELGNVVDPENIIDPDTIYNYRISPIRNAMRWMNRVFESYRQFGSDCKLIFTDGDGNYFAKGKMEVASCRIEDGLITENQTIDIDAFNHQRDAKPFLMPERVSFDYPMSAKEYRLIHDNPYGQIFFSSVCEEGYGYIDTISYKPEEGLATFNLIPKVM
jgi:hypothetical protein